VRTLAKILPFLLFPVGLLWLVRNDPFFWDTVQLASKHAHFFYENGLHWAPLPSEIDSGHPPFLGYYLALMWTVFGKSLPVSHLSMAPFLLLAIGCLYRLGKQLSAGQWTWWLLPIVLLDPVFAGQSVLVSPDLILASFFLLAVTGVLEKRNLLIVLGILGLCMVSMRGMMTTSALLGWALLRPGFPQTIKSALMRSRLVLPFLPGLLVAALFLGWHQAQSGWIGYHPQSAWAPAFERVGWSGFVRNTAVLAWRWLDFDRFFVWILGAVLVWRFYKPGKSSTDLGLLLLFLLLFLSPSSLMYHNLSAHRYFLPLFIALHLFVFQWIAQTDIPNHRKLLLMASMVIAMAGGNLWIYPRGISMDWDSTLAHQPWHQLRAEAIDYLETQHIDFQEVGSAFPNLATGEQMLLNGDQRRFADIDFTQNRFIFASNIFNDLQESDYAQLTSSWFLRKRFERAGVWIEIYENRASAK
jgi:hypothetical protein